MNVVPNFFVLFMSAACLAHCECRYDGCLYVTADDLVESDDGDLFLQIDDAYYPVDDIYDDQGFYFVEASTELGEYPEEYVIRCPCKGCGRYQTSLLLIRNKNRCSGCGQNIIRCQTR